METAPAPTRTAPLSNAERQRRWRERLKAKASGAAVVDHVRDVVARAIEALWAYHERPGPGGTVWAEIDGCRTIEDYFADLSGEDGGLLAAARAFAPGFEGMTAEEAQAVGALIELADVIGLREAGVAAVTAVLRGSRKPAARTRPKPAPRLALVASNEPARAEPADTEATDAPDQEEPRDRPGRLTAARRARRRALLRKWK